MMYWPSDLAMTSADLPSLPAEPVPASEPIAASAGEWRLAVHGFWRFWQAQEWMDD